jgi:branched-chain amino acid transport system permease protein
VTGLARRLLRANVIAAVAVILLTLALPRLVTNLRIVAIFTTANVFVMFATSWDILSGFTGQVNFGHAAFIGAGGFTVGLLSKYADLPAEQQLVLATVAAAALGLLVGAPCLRLTGPYLALVTLTAASALLHLAFVFKKQTGGEEGISRIAGLDEATLLGPVGRALARAVMGAAAFDELRPIDQETYVEYYVVLVVTLAVVALLLWVGFGRRGVVLRSIQQDELAAAAAGVPIVRYKLAAFVLSGALAGLAGGLQVLVRGSVGIDLLFVDLSLLVIVMAALGGAGSVVGPAAGAYLVVLTQNYVLDEIPMIRDHAQSAAIKTAVFSSILLVVLRLQPRGLVAPLLLRGRQRRVAGAALEATDA